MTDYAKSLANAVLLPVAGIVMAFCPYIIPFMVVLYPPCRILAAFIVLFQVSACTLLFAQTVNVPGGLPQHVNATYQELGLGGWTPPTSTGTQIISGDGTTTQDAPESSGSDALETLYQQSWGYLAAQNASEVGITADALAATCVVETGCQNVQTVAGKSGITGAFQMMQSTYDQELAKATANNSGLADQVASTSDGQHDPAVQAIAAAQYIKDGAQSLENAGVSNPRPSCGWYAKQRLA